MMSDSALDNAAIHGGLPPPDWQAVAPTIGIRSMAAIVLVVPLLLVAGVIWLRQSPQVIDPDSGGDVIEVRLAGPQTDSAQRPDVSEPAKAEQIPSADPSIDDSSHAIPAETVAPLPPEPLRLTMFRQALLAHIARYRQNPDGARLGRVSVQLVFSMLRDGTVTDVRITSSSGNAILDHAAVQTIRLAQPMPKIPPGLPQPFEVHLPITFDAR